MIIGIAVGHHGTGLELKLRVIKCLKKFLIRDTVAEEIILSIPAVFKSPEYIRIVQIIRNTRLHMKKVINGDICPRLVLGKELIESIVKAELALFNKLQDRDCSKSLGT